VLDGNDEVETDVLDVVDMVDGVVEDETTMMDVVGVGDGAGMVATEVIVTVTVWAAGQVDCSV